MGESLRIGFHCNEYPPEPHGGIGSYTKSLAEELSRKGQDVYIFGEGTKSGRQLRNGVVVETYQEPSAAIGTYFNALYRRWKASLLLRNRCQRHRIDVLEIPDWKGQACFLKSLPKTKIVIRLHGATCVLASKHRKRTSRLTEYFESKQLSAGDCHLAVSNHIAEWSKAFRSPGIPLQVIPLGVDTNFFSPSDEAASSDRFLFVGRTTPAKGIDRALTYFRSVADMNPDARLDIVGYTTSKMKEDALTAVPSSYQQSIVFHGRVSQTALREFYRKSQFLLFPSRGESFGLSILEAMACGCIPVVPEGSTMTSLVTPGQSGFVVDFSNPKDFTFSTEELRSYSEAARQEVCNRFSISRLAESMIEQYREVMRGGR